MGRPMSLQKLTYLANFKGMEEEKSEARRWRQEEEQGKEGGIGKIVRRGARIEERMVGGRVVWIRFHQSTCGFTVYPILLYTLH